MINPRPLFSAYSSATKFVIGSGEITIPRDEYLNDVEIQQVFEQFLQLF